MNSKEKTKAQLILELEELRGRISELETFEKNRNGVNKKLQIKESAIASSINAIAFADLTGKLQYANNSFLKMWGYDNENEILGKAYVKFFLRENEVARVVGALYKFGSWIGELTAIRKDGSPFDVQLSSNMITDKTGNNLCLVSYFVDVAQRNKMIKKLRKSEIRYRTILENFENGYLETDISGNFTFLNDTICTLFGHQKDELLGSNIRQFTDQFNAGKLFEITYNIFRTGDPSKTFNFEIIKKDGNKEQIEASFSLLKNMEGLPVGFKAIAGNISEKAQIEAKLIHSRDFLQSILRSSPYGIIISDLQGRVITASLSTTHFTGYGQQEIVGNKVSIFYQKQMEDENIIMKELLAKGKIRNHEMKFLKKNGKLTNVNISVSLLKNKGRKIIGTLIICRDTEEKPELYSQLQPSRKMEIISGLAGGIAHDFNNLLMGIQGYISLILMKIDQSHPHYERLKKTEKQIQLGTELTRQLTNLAGKEQYEIVPVNINKLIENSSNTFSRTKPEIEIQKKYGENIWQIGIDRGQIEQALLNLYLNAWYAMPGGGRLSLDTENVILDKDDTTPYQQRPGRYVKISVADRGIKMDEKTRGRIFDPFFSTKELGRGKGLGLVSVYSIITNNKGIIKVNNNNEGGTTFIIYLPASEEQVIEEKKSSKEAFKQKKIILFVDDEEMIIDVGRDILKSLDFEVIIAKSGKEAVKIYEKDQEIIDMVVLDMIMSDMGGGETFDIIRKINPAAKVLLSTGYSMDGQATDILNRGCNGYIQKPFNIEELSREITKILES